MKVRNVIRPNTNRGKAWKVMRAMNTFTITDIAITAEIPYENIKHYVQCLVAAGYVRQEGRKSVPGRSGFDKLFRLVKNTGPKPPVQKALRFLYDPNTGEFWSENPETAAKAIASLLPPDEALSAAPVTGKLNLKAPVRLLMPRKKKGGANVD